MCLHLEISPWQWYVINSFMDSAWWFWDPFRVQQEVDEVLGNKTSVNEADFEKLEYTEQVLKETLRLHAPFFASFPKETPPEGMKLNGYHIPGGTQVMVGIISILFSRLLKNPIINEQCCGHGTIYTWCNSCHNIIIFCQTLCSWAQQWSPICQNTLIIRRHSILNALVQRVQGKYNQQS